MKQFFCRELKAFLFIFLEIKVSKHNQDQVTTWQPKLAADLSQLKKKSLTFLTFKSDDFTKMHLLLLTCKLDINFDKIVNHFEDFIKFYFI
jgi:hypothetical protein